MRLEKKSEFAKANKTGIAVCSVSPRHLSSSQRSLPAQLVLCLTPHAHSARLRAGRPGKQGVPVVGAEFKLEAQREREGTDCAGRVDCALAWARRRALSASSCAFRCSSRVDAALQSESEREREREKTESRSLEKVRE
eukprot:3290774-Rhodomonas_salina.7